MHFCDKKLLHLFFFHFALRMVMHSTFFSNRVSTVPKTIPYHHLLPYDVHNNKNAPCYTFHKHNQCYNYSTPENEQLHSQHHSHQAILLAPAFPSYTQQVLNRINTIIPTCQQTCCLPYGTFAQCRRKERCYVHRMHPY